MIRINLLPHREMRRERRKKDFFTWATLAVIGAACVAVAVAFGISAQIDAQQARNDYIARENDKLDSQIKEIAQLREEIEGLRARQQAVENLRRDLTVPVHMMDELVRLTPEGMYLRQVKQDDRKVVLSGIARSNDQVSNLLRSLAHDTAWFERPELIEIKAGQSGKPDSRDARRIYEFSMNAMVKMQAVPDPAKPGAPAAVRPGPTPAAVAAPR